MQTLQQPFAHFFARMPYFAILLLLLLLGILLFRKTLRYTRASGEPFDFDKELTDRDNPAFGIYFAGYIVGLTIALTGTLSGVGTDPANALIGIAINSLVAIVLMRLGTFVNDRFILYRFDDKKEIIDDRNAGTAFVYLAVFSPPG